MRYLPSPLRGGVGGGGVERSDDCVHDAFHVPHYVGVPHAQNTKALLLEIALAPRIPPQLLIRAVRSAIEMQKSILEVNLPKPAEDRVTIRIGLNHGIGIVKTSDVFGDVVNVAKRLQESAGTGDGLR